MFLPPFFESKKFKIIMSVILGLELLVIVSLKIYGSFCEAPGCWNLKDAGTQYCWDHINSIYENSKKKSSGNSYSSWKSDPYDASNYDDPDDFADDWADEFGDGDYDGGYDDAYDYWEEENGNSKETGYHSVSSGEEALTLN